MKRERIQCLSLEQIRYGIERCKARLSGVMPMGIMTIDRVKNALSQYETELQRRGVKELEFKS